MIIFGCGYTGLRLAKRQRRQRGDVMGIVGRAESVSRLGDVDIPARWLDLDAPTYDASLPADRPVVYLIPPPRTGSDDTRLQRALGGLTPSRFVYISTTGIYGNRDGATVDEDDAPAPESARAQRRLAAETLTRTWCEAHNIPWVILRVPGIYGPHRLQLATVESQRPMLKASQAGPGNRIHVDDLVRSIEAALTTPNTGRIFNVGDGNPMTNTEFVSEVARQLGAPSPPTVDLATLRENVTPQAWSFLRESRRVDVQRMRNTLGVIPRFGEPRDGIAASLAEMNSD